jgi:hypothetical protein
MSELVETALRLLLASRQKRGESPPFQSSAAAEHSSMFADRDALYRAMEGR